MGECIWIRPGEAKLEELRAGGFRTLWNGLEGKVLDRNRLRRVERIEYPVKGFLKRFLGIQAKNALRLALTTRPRCRSQAFRELRILEELHAFKLGAPRALCAAEHCIGPWERRSLLLTAPLPGKPLSDLAEGPREDEARAAAETYGKALRAGIFLPDQGFDHVFRKENGSLSLLDFHNARTAPPPSPRELGRAVVRLFLSPGSEGIRRLELAKECLLLFLEVGARLEARPGAEAILTRRLAR